MQLIRPVYRWASIIFYWLVIVAVYGCGETDIADLTSYIKSVNARPQPAIEPLLAQPVIEPYTFNVQASRDPFKPVYKTDKQTSTAVAKANALRPDFTRSKEALEAYPLNSLQMVGTLSMGSVSWALVKTQGGIIHRVGKGNYMGENHGSIIQITEDSIDLVEIIQGEKEGLWQEKQQSLALP